MGVPISSSQGLEASSPWYIAMAPLSDHIEPDCSVDKSVEPVMVNTLEAEDLGHTPRTGFRVKRFIRSLGSKDAWFGDYVNTVLSVWVLVY